MAGVSKAEVAQWLDRIYEVTAAIHEILHEDPVESVQRKMAREALQREERKRIEEEKLARVKMRYEPTHYSRFERDDVIDAMLKAVDDPPGGDSRVRGGKPRAYLSKAETVALEEAQRLKGEGAKAVQRADWSRALELYTNAILLQPIDEALDTLLHNNRALVHGKLHHHLAACEDASLVLQREPRNVKALLRRAVALRHLYRPVEALRDVTRALQLEPENYEAVAQRAWLRRAEAELMERDRFLEAETRRPAGQANQAERLREAIACLSSAVTSLSDGGCAPLAVDDPAAFPGALAEILEVLQRSGTGACVHLATCGGLKPVLVLAQCLLRRLRIMESGDAAALDEKSGAAGSTRRGLPISTVLVLALRVLSEALDASEVVTQDIAEDEMRALIAHLVKWLARCTKLQAGAGDGGGAGIDHYNVILQCLTSFCTRYPALVRAALATRNEPAGGGSDDGGAGCGLLLAMWGSGPLKHDAAAGPSSWVALYFFTELLNALVKSTSGCQAGAGGLWDELYGHHVERVAGDGGDGGPLVLAAVLRVFGSPFSSPPQRPALPVALASLLQTAAARLALRLTALTEHADGGDSEGGDLVVREALYATGFTASLKEATQAVFERAGAPGQPLTATDTRLLEALYALVYNLLLLAQPREVYVQQWLALNDAADQPTAVSARALQCLAAPQTPAKPLTPLSAMMWGVIAKFMANGDAALGVYLSREASDGNWGLWRWVAVALEADAAGMGNDTDDSEERGMAWVHLDHLTTVLATLQQRQHAALATRVDEKVGLLLDLVARAPLPNSADAVRGVALDGDGGPGGQTWPTTAAVVAMGNGALLLSMLPGAPAAYVDLLPQRLVQLKAVDVLLRALREARSCAHLLAREAAQPAPFNAVGSGGVAQSRLRRCYAQMKAAERNVAIALSRVCAVGGEAMKERLRALDGFETLVAVQKDQGR